MKLRFHKKILYVKQSVMDAEEEDKEVESEHRLSDRIAKLNRYKKKPVAY